MPPPIPDIDSDSPISERTPETSTVSSYPLGLEHPCLKHLSCPQAFDGQIGVQSFPSILDIDSDLPSSARKPETSTVSSKTKPAAILAANQITDTSSPHDWPVFILPLYPQRTSSSTTHYNMEAAVQTPATQETPLNPVTEMTEATHSPVEEITVLNALLIETKPLAFLETIAPGNAFPSLNAQATALLTMPDLPEIPPSISRNLIKALREGQKSMDTAILNELTISACENATATVDASNELKEYNAHLGKLIEEIPPLIDQIDALTNKLATCTASDEENQNLLFQYKLALSKLSGDLKKTQEAIPGLSLNASARYHLSIRKALLRNFRYSTLSWHSAAEISAGQTYPQLVGVSSTGYSLNCTDWGKASHTSIQECRAEGPQRPRPQEPFAMLPVTHQAFPLHCDTPLVTASGLTLFKPVQCNPLVVDQDGRVQLVIYGWSATTETALFTGLQRLPFDILNSSPVKTQRSTQIKNITCYARNMTNTLWKFLTHRSFKLQNDITVAMKVTVPPSGALPTYYHAWGVINPDCEEWSVTGLPLAAETFFQGRGINVIFNCQKLQPNWIDMITNAGTCDIVFRGRADLEAYRAFDTNMKPFLISRVSGHATLVESKPNEVVFREQLGPFRLSVYNLSFTTEEDICTLLHNNRITISGYEVLVNGARQTHRLGFANDSERLKTSLLLGGKRLPGLNNNQPIQVSLDVGCPARRCFHCYHPDHPSFSMGHLARECHNTHRLCTVCHQLDHLTSACPWTEAQVTLSLPRPPLHHPGGATPLSIL